MHRRRRNKQLRGGFRWPLAGRERERVGERARGTPQVCICFTRQSEIASCRKGLSLILLPDVHGPSFVSILLHRGDDWQSNKRVMLLHLITARHLHWTLRAIWQPWHGGDLLCQINTSPRIYIVAATMPLPVHWISKCFKLTVVFFNYRELYLLYCY